MPTVGRTWPLLTVDGGGMRGLLAARMLQEIERRMDRPAVDVFATGAGTSTGALLVAGALGPDEPASAERLAACYRDMGPRVFGAGVRVSLRGDVAAQGRLREVVEGVVGVRRLADVRRRVLVTAADVGRRAPVVLDSADGPSASLADAVLASSALPGYFPPVPIGGAQLVDGGLWAKDPTAAVLERLATDGPGLVVSLGTGTTRGTQARAEGVMDLVAATLGIGRGTTEVPGVQVLRLEPPLPPGVGRPDAAGPRDVAALDEVAVRYIAQAASEFERVATLLQNATA